MIKSKPLLIRKTHRYLGLFIGIQFLGWTISGLYFSWTDIDNVHGDHLRRSQHYLAPGVTVVSPTEAIVQLRSTVLVDSISSVNLISIGGKPTYQLMYFSGHVGEGTHHHIHHALADASSGELRGPLTKEEAVIVAQENIVAGAKLASVDLLTSTNGHHEFRDRPLPAYAVSFKDPDCTVYVSAELGTFQTVRHDQWRVFDFLWMFHTMDYESRDNINNWALRIFSIFGLVTVLSGFLLYFVSSPLLKKLTSRL
jgi:hypothetical protein